MQKRKPLLEPDPNNNHLPQSRSLADDGMKVLQGQTPLDDKTRLQMRDHGLVAQIELVSATIDVVLKRKPFHSLYPVVAKATCTDMIAIGTGFDVPAHMLSQDRIKGYALVYQEVLCLLKWVFILMKQCVSMKHIN